MKSPPHHATARFSSMLWACLSVLFLTAIAFLLYVWTEKRIDRANELRYVSRSLLAELRQSSDDLTRMARTYVATGDAQYRKNYQEIIDIRDGLQPRPQHYDNVYWDLVLDRRRRPTSAGAPVALMERIQGTSFTPAELSLLTSAKDESDRLTAIENKALAVRDFGGDDPQAVAHAMAMLYDDAYHRAKAAIMEPIARVNDSVERRTLLAIESTSSEANMARLAFMLFALALLALLWRAKRNLESALGCSVDQLRDAIERLGRGGVNEALPVRDNAGESIWTWLAGMQQNLARLDGERAIALARSQRIGRLYAALSQCNQAIVRSTSEQELFDEVCDAVVTYGGMSMAWVGMIDDGPDAGPGRAPAT
ncbi:MAG TPA: diguanylate cyclase, partial [Duganella sp.]|nr:diguanylate cyclase [Duganella sp.]